MKKYLFINLSLAFLVAVAVIALYYAQLGFFEGVERNTYDLRFKLRGGLPPSGGVAVIAIDETSIGQLGRFPWSRKYYAGFINAVSDAGAKALLFDVFFPESESPEADGAFAAAMRRSGITTLPLVVEFSAGGGIARITENIPELQSASKNECTINIVPDEDGVIRWTPLVITGKDKSYPAIGLIGAKEALGAETVSTTDFKIMLGNREIPVNPIGGSGPGRQLRMLINYTGPERTFQMYSFSDVLSGKVGRAELKDRVLLLGSTAMGIYDLRVTPFSNNMPGVEVNANIIENIVKGNFIKAGAGEALLDIAFIAVLAFSVFAVLLRVRALVAFPFVIALTAGYSYFAYVMFLRGHWLSMVYPVLSIIVSFSIASSLRFFIVEKKAKEVRAMFSSYVSKKVVDELVRHPERAKVGGERKTLTILFADVRGYTSFSERHGPEEVVGTLNEFLAAMTDVIMEHDGTLDKFLGDGIMAFWGAPLEQENHPELAVRCAMGMVKKMQWLQGKWLAEGKESLECGIGLNTGEVIVGNIGVEGKKLDYTVIGDNVNITHRLQVMSREAKSPVISETLYERVKDKVEVEPLGEVAVKGRHATVKIFALRGLKSRSGS
ncbi:MAG: adenylate/guanylate cyclase domain-containing protein [Thermodesulfovibrionales bacterium]|nr:adenylate/guanylate cyclase domain-containing protein [Thermodesulfovibrionales bacterium]